jgi:uncharacterized protein (TIGR01777 family)
MSKKRIVIAGGTGFIGSELVAEAFAQYSEVFVLTRRPKQRNDSAVEVEWTGQHMGEWIKVLEGADAVINLAGRSINCPHTSENIRELTESRVKSVRAIGIALDHVKSPPPVWIQASALGFYGNSEDRICTENTLNGINTLADITRQWENAFNLAQPKKMPRKVLLRMGMVLGRKGGALPVLRLLTKCFLGGKAGNGRQYISWIHIQDLARMFMGCIDYEGLTGVFNAVAPNPVTNEQFMRELRHTLHRPWSPPAPAWAVRKGARMMKTEPSLVLTGCRAVPKRLTEAGFQFDFPDLEPTLKHLLQ